MALTDEQRADAVRFVEDAIDATSEYRTSGYEACTCRVPTSSTGAAVVDALLEAGWIPPT